MKLLLDTQVLIWQITNHARLDDSLKDLIESSKNNVYVSWASVWEISIKASLNKLDFNISLIQLNDYLKKSKYQILDFDFKHFDVLNVLPHYHKDPFDRLIVAQAISEQFTIITSDTKIKLYEVACMLNN